MTISHYINVRMQKYTKLCMNTWHLDELVIVSWDDNICKLMYKNIVNRKVTTMT